MKKPAPDRRRSADLDRGHADAHGDFYFDELMTPQPDATREYYRSRIEQPAVEQEKDD